MIEKIINILSNNLFTKGCGCNNTGIAITTVCSTTLSVITSIIGIIFMSWVFIYWWKTEINCRIEPVKRYDFEGDRYTHEGIQNHWMVIWSLTLFPLGCVTIWYLSPVFSVIIGIISIYFIIWTLCNLNKVTTWLNDINKNLENIDRINKYKNKLLNL